MSDATESRETIYTSSDTATMLKVQESTLRKYCIMLEEGGYKFHKNDFGHRGFFNNDVIVLKRLIEIKKHPDMTLKQACNAVISWVSEGGITDHDITDITENERHNEGYKELLEEFRSYREEQDEFKKQQSQFNEELIKQLQKQQEFIQNGLAERDKKLVEALRETQQTQKLIAAAQEEKQKKKWWEFWK